MITKYLKTYYNQDWVYKEIKRYFKIQEFVAPQVISKYGELQCWSFMDFRLLSNVLWVRRTLERSITINTGGRVQRGLRSIMSKIVLGYVSKGRFYLSAHIRGSAVDMDVKAMQAYEVRNWLEKNFNGLPYKCRLENKKNGKQISWVHMDVDYFPDYPKVYRFNI